MNAEERRTIFASLREIERDEPVTARERAALDCARHGRAAIARRLRAIGYSGATAYAAADVVELVIAALESGRMAPPLSKG